MVKLHPSVVHFPLALLSTAVLFALIYFFTKKELFKEIIFWNLVLGVISSLVATASGLWEEQTLIHDDEIHELLEPHKFNGFAINIVFFTLLMWFWLRRQKIGKAEFTGWLCCLVIAEVMIFFQGYVGGRMVFEKGAGVKPMETVLQSEGDSSHHHHHHDEGSTNHSHGQEDSSHTHISGDSHDHQQHHKNGEMKMDSTVENQTKKKELKDMPY